MSLTDKINSDIKAAMLAKESKKLEALRAVKAELLLAKTNKSNEGEISEDTEIKILQKLVKQRKESAELYRSQNRPELAEDEEFQYAVIEKYLPEQMGEDELKNIIQDIIKKVGAESMRDMGKVMGMASKELAGKADNKVVSGIVKELLSK
ncbi:GatB/YqeY domain-containing protein [Bacteroidota bacterium]